MSDPGASNEPLSSPPTASSGGRPRRGGRVPPGAPDRSASTEPLSSALPGAGEPSRREKPPDRREPDPIETFKREDNWVKLLLTVAALSAISLVLLVAVAVAVLREGRSEQVIVDNVPCIVVPEQEGNALYCRR